MINPKKGLWPFLLFAVLSITSHEVLAGERISIVTTIPTLKDFVREVGGERVVVTSLLKGGEDLHTYDPRPNDAKSIFNAVIIVKVGIGLDGWVDRAIKASGNKKVVVLEASQGVEVIRSGSESTSHTSGNPHIWLDPENAKVMVENIYRSLAAASPDGAVYFRANRDAYIARLSELERDIEGIMSGVKDRRVVTYHPGWAYLLKRIQASELFSIERAPGREPSARELAAAIDTVRREKIRVILSEPEAPRKVVDIVAREGGAAVAILAPEVGSSREAGSYIDMVRYNVREIAKGLK